MTQENHETRPRDMDEKDTVDHGSKPQYALRMPSPLSEETEALVARLTHATEQL
jgi:hypothetical protein